MSDKEVSEKAISEHLEYLMEKFDGDLHDIRKTIRFFAKIIFNLRFDLDELKIELLKTLTGEDGECEVNHKLEEEDGRFYT